MSGTVAVFVAMDEEAQPFLARAESQGAEEVVGGAKLRALRLGQFADDAEEHRLRSLLLLSVNGVAAGLQNTG